MDSLEAGLAIENLSVAYGGNVVVSDVSLVARRGVITGIAGESGSGKTTAMLASMGYTPPGGTRTSGQVTLGETSISEARGKGLRKLWATRISYVSQDAVGSLNPSRRVGSLLREVLEVNSGMDRTSADRRAAELLASMQIADPGLVVRRYPHELSGGQAQRVALAMALAPDPDLLILDEPTTGLDVTTQAEVLEVLRHAIAAKGIAGVYVSHDLSVLSAIADELLIFYAGEIVESGPTESVLTTPHHPYTRALLDAIPSLSGGGIPRGLPGLPPGHAVSDACAFAPRCAWATEACVATHPELLPMKSGSRVRCMRQPELGPLGASSGRASPSLRPLAAAPPLLAIRNLVVDYGRGASRVRAVDDVSMLVQPGTVVALVGESGSGKSTIGRTLVGLVQPTEGQLIFDGLNLPGRAAKRTKVQRRDIQIVFQNPAGALNPRHTVRQLMTRSFALFRPDVPRHERDDAISAALAETQLHPGLCQRYPHQLSGGQRQRVAIARALACRPRLLVCDEVVSSQDVSVQAAILSLLRDIQERHAMTLIFISHDLAVTRAISDYAYVIQHGRIVEEGPVGEMLDRPSTEYTERLVNASPRLGAPQLAAAEG